MNRKDIEKLIEILKFKKRDDLASLLYGSKGEIEESDSFGSYWNSNISSYVIYSPLEAYYKIKELGEDNRETILTGILDIYPHRPEAPEIRSLEFRLLHEQDGGDGDSEYSYPEYTGQTIRIFLSYSTDDKVLAGEIKEKLEGYGLSVFLAHEDISPSSEWQEAILQNLDSTDVFVPIITSSFPKSKWTDQESGIAYSKDKAIIPLAIEGNNPYGFIGKYQALKFNTKDVYESCKEIASVIYNNKRFRKLLADSLIKIFIDSHNWSDAGIRAEKLLYFDQFTDEQINTIAQAAIQNDQIYGSFSANSKLRSFFAQHSNVDSNLRKKLQQRGI